MLWIICCERCRCWSSGSGALRGCSVGDSKMPLGTADSPWLEISTSQALCPGRKLPWGTMFGNHSSPNYPCALGNLVTPETASSFGLKSSSCPTHPSGETCPPPHGCGPQHDPPCSLTYAFSLWSKEEKRDNQFFLRFWIHERSTHVSHPFEVLGPFVETQPHSSALGKLIGKGLNSSHMQIHGEKKSDLLAGCIFLGTPEHPVVQGCCEVLIGSRSQPTSCCTSACLGLHFFRV